VSAEPWDESYAADYDPYGYAVDERQSERYRWQLAALGDGHFGRGLELACSIGVLTTLLADRCDEVLAVDVSEVAVERARRRLATRPAVTVEQRTLPADWPAGEFDLIVASDVFCYWTPGLVREGVRRCEDSLAPGGVLLVSNWLPFTPTHALSGDAVHRIVRRTTTLERDRSDRHGEHRLDCFVKTPRPEPR